MSSSSAKTPGDKYTALFINKEDVEYIQVEKLVKNTDFNKDVKIKLVQGIVTSEEISTDIILEIPDDFYQKIEDELKAKASLLHITFNLQHRIRKSLKIEKTTKLIETEYGVYKRDIFDQAFAVYKTLCAMLGGSSVEDKKLEIGFISFQPDISSEDEDEDDYLEYNPELVDISPVSEMNGETPLITFIKYASFDSGCKKITISNVNLPSNMATLKEILALFT